MLRAGVKTEPPKSLASTVAALQDNGRTHWGDGAMAAQERNRPFLLFSRNQERGLGSAGANDLRRDKARLEESEGPAEKVKRETGFPERRAKIVPYTEFAGQQGRDRRLAQELLTIGA